MIAPAQIAGRASLEAWTRIWSRCGAGEGAEIWHSRLIFAYQEPQRIYHSLSHLCDSLRHFDSLRAVCHSPQHVETALWFHDAVYDPRSHTNEEDSARLFEEFAGKVNLVGAAVAEIRNLILLTKNHTMNLKNTDAEVMLDADLAILGQSPREYEAYASAIRTEYEWVQNEKFRNGRRKLLSSFLSRPRIYHTTEYFNRYESQARFNLQTEMNALVP